MGGLIERYGQVTIARLVHAFYRDVLESPRLDHYFRGVDMETLVAHQAAFMRAVLGDTTAYTRDHIRQVHQGYHISGDDFEEMLRLLRARLLEYQFTEEDADTVIDSYRSYRTEVIANPS